MGEHIGRLEHEEAAIRALQRPRLDLAKVGDHRADRVAVLDPADQVGEARVALDHDRRTRAVAVGDEDVGAVARVIGSCHLQEGQQGRRRRCALALTEIVEVVEQGDAHVRQMVEHLRQIVVALLQLGEVRAEHERDDLAVEHARPLCRLLLDNAHLAHVDRRGLLHLLAVLLDLALGVRRELRELLARERLPGHDRHRRDAGGRQLQREAALPREGGEPLPARVTSRSKLGEAVGTARRHILAVEHARDLAHRRGHELVQVGGEGRAAAAGQAQRARPLRVLEVVDVHPVVGRRLTAGETRKLVAHRLATAAAGPAGDVQVEACRLDREAKLDRGERARLADGALEGRQLGRAAERDVLRGDPPAQLRRLQTVPRSGRCLLELALHAAIVPARGAARQAPAWRPSRSSAWISI